MWGAVGAVATWYHYLPCGKSSIKTRVGEGVPMSFEISVTSLGDFKKLLMSKFLAKVAPQFYGDFLATLKTSLFE